LRGFFFALAEEELHGQGGPLHPSRRIEGGDEVEADIPHRGGHGPPRDSLPESHYARPCALPEHREPFPYNNAVFTGKGHHVADCAQRDEIEVFAGKGEAESPVERLHELENDADACKALEWIGAVFLTGIDDGMGAGKLFGHFVVVGNHHGHAQFSGQCNRLQVAYAAVDGNDKVNALPGGFFDRSFGKAVPFFGAVGNIVIGSCACVSQA